jgi:aminoglycoside/choline kinase family phosphotransferase
VNWTTDRESAKRAFLANAGLTWARRVPLAGDASTRSYERLHMPDGRTLILMDAPPAAESKPCPPKASPSEREAAGYNAMARLSAGRISAFAACAGYLRSRGLSAPEIIAVDTTMGLAVLEDLGENLFVDAVQKGVSEQELYFAAIDALLHLHETPPPVLLESDEARWPLLTYDDLALKTGANLFVDWAPKLLAMADLDDTARAEWDRLWSPVRARGVAGATVFTHRDYHAENLVWLPEREGPARVGMLDFQDALRAHPAWDLLSLLQDARRDVPPELETACLARYLKARPEMDPHQFMRDYYGLAALNNTRILGIFSRLIVRDGKTRYGGFMPRVWNHLERDLRAPGLEDLNAWFSRYAPTEAREAA